MERSLNGARLDSFRLGLAFALALLTVFAFFDMALALGCSTPGTCHEPLGTCISNYSTPNASFCSCRSGYYGDYCNLTATSTCTFETLSGNGSFSTTNISVSFISDYLEITVSTDLVRERNYTIIAIDDSAVQNLNCTYPGPYWNKTVYNCADVYLSKLPWSDNIPCGWNNSDSDASFTRYKAQLLIEHHDFIQPFLNRTSASPVERIVQHIQPLTVNFPKNIGFNADITLEAPVRLLQQIIKVDPTLSTIDFATNLIWPYYLVNFTVVSGPNLTFTFNATSLTSDCPIDGVSSCTQSFEIAISPEGACDINGDYQVTWNIACRPDNTTTNEACAYPPGYLINGTISILTGKTCATISTTVPITGGLAVYDDAAQSAYSPINKIGAVMYYRAACSSTNVTVTGVTINTVKITADGTPDLYLLLNGVAVEPGYSASQFTFGEQGLEFADFSIVLTESLFPDLVVGQTRTYTTRIIADVDYISPNAKKRDIVETQVGGLNTYPIAISQSFKISNPSPTSGPSAASKLGLTLTILIPFTTLILFIVLPDSRA